MLIYRLLTILLSPVILGHIIWLSIKSKQSRYFWQRLGFHYSHLPANSLWFHCASVGEVNTLLPLIKNIHNKDKNIKIIITTNTITGGLIVKQQNLPYILHSYLPFDWLHSINRFLTTIKPKAIYVMETEIWPNLFTACKINNTPVTLINARLSSKTTSSNNWIKSLLKRTLSQAAAIHTRTDEDKNAYVKIGADPQIITTTGNLKVTTGLVNKDNYDKENDFQLEDTDREYILLASTHKNEELEIYNEWKKLNRNELLIIAPRHPERSHTIISQLNCDNIAIRSKNQKITKTTEVYILDTIGELKNYFANAKLVIMGGSFSPIGGHNILEPAGFNKAIITGPHMENFKEELDLMSQKKAILQASSIDELTVQLTKLLSDTAFKSSLEKNTCHISSDIQEVLNKYTRVIFSA